MKPTPQELEEYLDRRAAILQEVFREAAIFERDSALKNEDFRIAQGVVAVFERFCAQALRRKKPRS